MWNNQTLGLPNWAGSGIQKIASNVLPNVLNLSSINVSSIFTNYISSGVANISQLNISTINGIPFPETNSNTTSSWSLYPAICNVNMNNYNLNSVRLISSSAINTSSLKANFANISTLYTSTLQFQTAIGIDLGISSFITNRGYFRTDISGSDPLLAFIDESYTNIYGAIGLIDNTSTFVIGTSQNLQFTSGSSINMSAQNYIDITTVSDISNNSYVQVKTDVIALDADFVGVKGVLSTNIITSGYISTNTIIAENYLGFNSSFTSQWSLTPAISTVHAELDFFNLPQYDIKDFKNINGNFLNAKVVYNPIAPTIPIGGTVNADISVNAPTGDFGVVVATNGFIDEIQAENITVSDIITNQADVNIYGKLLPPGDSALFVEGGVVLDGGTIHGTTIGCLPVGGVNTVRLDVLPTGIDIVTPTYITIDSLLFANMASGGAISISAGAATSVAAGGALSLAGGSYIEYNTDQNYFINTSAGNDYTDIYVGNIHGADQGTAPLRINENRGVQIDNVTELNLRQNIFAEWNSGILYSENTVLNYLGANYVSLLSNRNITPALTGAIPSWTCNVAYNVGNYARVEPPLGSSNTWYCQSNISAACNVVVPNNFNQFFSNVWLPLSNITNVNQIWVSLAAPTNSKIEGDKASFIRLGAVSTIMVSSFQIDTKLIYTETIGQPNPLVPTNINFNNGIDLQANDIINGDVISANTFVGSNFSASNIITSNITVSSITGFNNRVVIPGFLSTQSIHTSSITAFNIITSNITVSSITGFNNRVVIPGFLSTQSIHTSSITAFNMNISTITASRIQTVGGGTFQTNYDFVSTATVRTNTLQSASGSGTVTTFSLQPINATQVLNTNLNVPWFQAGISFLYTSNIFSFNINTRTLSTNQLLVSTINQKLPPYTSTLNIFPGGVSNYTFSGLITTPQILISNVSFPHLGNYLVTSKMTVTKASGGAGAEPYGSLCLSRGLFPSTFTTQDGFNVVPYLNHTNISTFNTYTTSVSITNLAQRTRFLTYYDTSGHNYSLRMGIGDFRIRYIPSEGSNPDNGIS